MIISPRAYKNNKVGFKIIGVVILLYMNELAGDIKQKPSACRRRVLNMLYSTINICSALVCKDLL
jgi:hypothetical protein